MSNDTAQVTDQGASAVITPVSSTPSTAGRAIDDSGFVVGQSWEHDGFAIVAKLVNPSNTEDATLQYVASELKVSQAAHARQFQYTQTFVTLEAAQTAIDAAQQDVFLVASLNKPGYNDKAMTDAGWTRLPNR